MNKAKFLKTAMLITTERRENSINSCKLEAKRVKKGGMTCSGQTSYHFCPQMRAETKPAKFPLFGGCINSWNFLGFWEIDTLAVSSGLFTEKAISVV